MDKIDYLLKFKKEHTQNHAAILGICADLGKERPITDLTREVIKELKHTAAEELKLYRGCCYALAPLMCNPTGDVQRLLYRLGNLEAYAIASCPKEIEPYRNRVDALAEYCEHDDTVKGVNE